MVSPADDTPAEPLSDDDAQFDQYPAELQNAIVCRNMAAAIRVNAKRDDLTIEAYVTDDGDDLSLDRAWRSAKPVTPADLVTWAETYGDDVIAMVRDLPTCHPHNLPWYVEQIRVTARIAGRFGCRALSAWQGASVQEVVTYRFAYVPGEISLCPAHDDDLSAGGTRGPVHHGQHAGICDVCARQAVRS